VLLRNPSIGDDEFAVLLGCVLRAGVTIAAAIVTVGAVVYLAKRGTVHPDYQAFTGEPADLRSIRGILSDAAHGSGRGLIQLGLLVLIATPIVRVLCSIAGFWREGDRIYVFVTLTVLGLLAYSLLAA
jgi:uncharacterized membrane protein